MRVSICVAPFTKPCLFCYNRCACILHPCFSPFQHVHLTDFSIQWLFIQPLPGGLFWVFGDPVCWLNFLLPVRGDFSGWHSWISFRVPFPPPVVLPSVSFLLCQSKFLNKRSPFYRRKSSLRSCSYYKLQPVAIHKLLLVSCTCPCFFFNSSFQCHFVIQLNANDVSSHWAAV